MVITDQEKEFSDLLGTMRTLRSESGCDWDRAQTHESLKPYLVEEAYEVLDAIDKGEDRMLLEELGDLLLQVLFHAQIASERGSFDCGTIIENLNKKLVRRHPHVFEKAAGYSYRQWEKIKAREKGSEECSPVGKMNTALPALSLARRIVENAEETGLEKLDPADLIREVNSLVLDLSGAVKLEDNDMLDETVGRLLLSIAKCAVLSKLDPERCLRQAVEKYVNQLDAAHRHKEES